MFTALKKTEERALRSLNFFISLPFLLAITERDIVGKQRIVITF